MCDMFFLVSTSTLCFEGRVKQLGEYCCMLFLSKFVMCTKVLLQCELEASMKLTVHQFFLVQIDRALHTNEVVIFVKVVQQVDVNERC